MSRRFRKPLEKKSVREDRKGDKRSGAKRGSGKSASGKPGSGKPSWYADLGEARPGIRRKVCVAPASA